MDTTPADNENTSWSSLFVTQEIIKALEENNMSIPTPIQKLSIPLALKDGLDLLGAAQTGSGKTLAFGIPLVQLIEENNRWKNDRKLKGLVLTPTRELALQIKKHLDEIIKYTTVTVGVVFGGLSSQKQERVLSKLKPDILVATPGRLWELINELDCEHVSSDNVAAIKYLVIDEADKMTEKGHFEELRNIVAMIKEKQCKVKRQTFVFSATLTFVHEPPIRGKNKKKLITPRKKLRYLMRTLGMSKDFKVIDLTQSGIGTPGNEQLTETMIECNANEKDLYLYYFLLKNPGKSIIFCNSKDCLRRLANLLRYLQLEPTTLHASLNQKRRLVSLERFSQNSTNVLIASDIAARGLDISKVDHVIHYQVPRTVEIYVHRSGRTARLSNKGLSLILCEPKENYNYLKLCNAVNKGKQLDSYPIDQHILSKLKERISLARQVDVLSHRLRKNKADCNFFKKMAKECDIDLEDRDDLVLEVKNESKQMKKLKLLEKQLKKMLKKKLFSKNGLALFPK